MPDTGVVSLISLGYISKMGAPDLSPPTDNLYKFVAITGLLIIGWTSAALVYLDYRVKDAAVVAMAISESTLVKIRMAREEAAVKQPISTPPSEDLGQRAKVDGIEAGKLENDFRSASGQVTDANADYMAALKWCWIPFGVGIVFVGVGFTAWLFLIQLKEDKLTDLNIAKTQIELDLLLEKLKLPPAAKRKLPHFWSHSG